MNYSDLKDGQKIYFIGEGIPMELIARSENYGCVVRSLDINEDFDLLYHRVEMGDYWDCKSALESLKNTPVYSLLDFREEKKAPSNLLFAGDIYDFWSKRGCRKACLDLERGKHELSRRNGCDLRIDWKRTLEAVTS
jgi:hypothetical protein